MTARIPIYFFVNLCLFVFIDLGGSDSYGVFGSEGCFGCSGVVGVSDSGIGIGVGVGSGLEAE